MAEDDAVDLNAQLEVELTPFASLDLDAEWVAYLSQSAEIPTCVAGVDPNINDEGGDGDAVVA